MELNSILRLKEIKNMIKTKNDVNIYNTKILILTFLIFYLFIFLKVDNFAN